MSNDGTGQPPTENSNGQPLSNAPPDLTREQDIVGNNSQQPTKTEQTIAGELAGEFRKAERWTIGINGLTLVALIVAAGIYSGQLQQMTTQTELLAVQTASSSREAVVASDRLQRQLDAFNRQADASQKQVDVITRQMRLDQRAWLKVDIAEYKPIGEGRLLWNTVRFKNIGKTLARKAVLYGWVEAVTSKDPPHLERVDEDRQNYHTRTKSGGYYPGDYENVDVSRKERLGDQTSSKWQGYRQKVMAHEEATAYDVGELYIATYGIVTYKDIFGISHEARYCFWQANLVKTQKEFPGALKCAEFNNSDNR